MPGTLQPDSMRAWPPDPARTTPLRPLVSTRACSTPMGVDRSIDANEIDLTALGERQLAWVDIDLDAGGTLDVSRRCA